MVDESTESWAKSVENLLEDHQRPSILSENSRSFAEDYSEEKIAKKVLRIYRRVIFIGKYKQIHLKNTSPTGLFSLSNMLCLVHPHPSSNKAYVSVPGIPCQLARRIDPGVELRSS